jgi:hypothetical protein
VRLFPPSDVVFFLTHGGCSCDLYSEPVETTAEEDEAADRARYRRKGWSQSKIDRAIEAKAKPHAGPHEDRQRFCDAISLVVQRLGRVRLLAHQYEGRIDTEDVGPADSLRMALALFARQRGAFPLDTLVEVVRDAG